MNYAQKMWKRVLSMVLAIVITLSIIPVTETQAATANSVELDQTEVTLEEVGSTKEIAINAVYDDAGDPQTVADCTAEWTSEKESIVTVDANGQLTAVGAGATKVNVTAEYTDADGNKKTSSGSVDVEVYVTPVVTITASTDTTVSYPTAVTFGVNCNVATGGATTLEISDEQGNPVSYTKDQAITLEVGTYKLTATVEAEENGYYKAGTATMEYVVTAAEVADVKDITVPEKVDCGEQFTIELPTQSQAGTYNVKITGLTGGELVLDKVASGTPINLVAPETSATLTVEVTFNPTDTNYAQKEFASKQIDVNTIELTKTEITVKNEVYWNDKIELVLPEQTTAAGAVAGKYNVSVSGLEVVDANNQTITDLSALNPNTTIYLIANTVTNDGKVTINFEPTSTKYGKASYGPVNVKVKALPVTVSWDDSQFNRKYNGSNLYETTQTPTVEVNYGNDYQGEKITPKIESRNNYVFKLTNSSTGTYKDTKLETSLKFIDESGNLVDSMPGYELTVQSVTVKIEEVVLDADNIEFGDISGKQYDGTSSAQNYVTVNLVNPDNIEVLNNELSSLILSYDADYYDANGTTKECGDPEKAVTTARIKITDLKIVDANGNPSANYIFANNTFKLTEDEEGKYLSIFPNAGFIDFTGADFGEPVTDLRDLDGDSKKEKIEIYWFGPDENKEISISDFTFSTDPTSTDWNGTYTVNTSEPTKIYAKDSEGLVSGGIYVAMDSIKPMGNIYATVLDADKTLTDENKDDRISIAELINQYKTLATGKNIYITFEASDLESEISKIEIYGSDRALEINAAENASDEEKEAALEKVCANITGYEVLDNINNDVEKKNPVSHVVEINSSTDLKKFYYVRITDYAGNVSYISSSGVLQDITAPTAEIELITATDKTFNGKNVYGENGQDTFNVEFRVALNDPEKASGISNVKVELKDANGNVLQEITQDDNCWDDSKCGTFKNAIINLPNDNPTDAQIDAAQNGTLVGSLNLEDGFYTLTVVATDNVGLTSQISSVSFVVDNTAPEIIIENNLESNGKERTKNNLYTGGKIKVTVTELTLTTSLENLLKGTGIAGKDIEWNVNTVDTRSGLQSYEAELTFGEDGQFKEGEYDFAVNAADAAGNNQVQDSKGPADSPIGDKNGKFIIDYTAPLYTLVLESEGITQDDGKVYYGKGKALTATFTIDEATSYDDRCIEITVMKNDEEAVIKWTSDAANDVLKDGYTFTHDKGSKKFVITIESTDSTFDGEYKFEISGKDMTGNKLTVSDDSDDITLVHVMDATAPVLKTVEYDTDGKFTNEDGIDYVNENVNMIFTIEEHNPTSTSEATVTSMENGKPFGIKWNASSTDEYQATFDQAIEMLGDGDLQKVTLTIVDKAGNIAVKDEDLELRSAKNTSFEAENGKFTDNFVIDTLDPKIKLVYLGKADSGSLTGINPINTIAPVDYFNDKVYVKVIVTEHNFKKDLFSDSISFGGTTLKVAETEWRKSGNKDEYVKIYTYAADNQYNLSVTGVDCAQNPLDWVDNSDMSDALSNNTVKLQTAVDTTLPSFGDKAKPIVVIKPGSPKNETTDGQVLYNSDVTFEVTVYDPYLNKYASGINQIDMKVIGEDGTTATWKMDKDGNVTSGGSGISVTRVSGSLSNYAKGAANKYVFHVTLSSDTFNTNGIVLSAIAEDIALNKSDEAESDEIAIDVTAPKVLVKYDNNDVSNEKYFHADRIATVLVTERNFSNDCLQFIINGQSVELNFTLQSQGSGNRDDAVWVATYAFNVDGDYKIDVKCVDRAQNEGTVKYEGAAPQDFTIDKTIPIITVVYDNNDFLNEYYYKEARTATITIEEHNFSSADVVISLTAENDGQVLEVPAVNGWTTDGDINTATINYNYDAEFTFDIEYADLATNEAEDYEMDRFIVDMTAPELEIFDIEHLSANNGEVRPGIRYYDTNYDKDGTVILMTGYHNGVVEMTGSRKLEANGLEMKLDDFAYVQEMDDMYTMEATVYDLAGNSSEAMVMFSVNRFGSVYTFDKATDKLVGDNGKYYTNKEQQLVITETNVDTLEFKEITMNLNGNLVTLEEGVDYTVKASGTEATWKQYVYTLKAENFVEEGTYIVTIYSEDRATNTSDNNIKGKKVEFVVDKTNPSVLISGIEDGGRYRTSSKEMTIDVEDNVRLAQVIVTIDGVETIFDAAQINEADGKLVLNISNAKHWQDVKVKVVDAAGNKEESEELRVLVTANLWIQFYMNKPVFFGTLGGGAALLALLWWFLFGKKKKKEEEEQAQ